MEKVGKKWVNDWYFQFLAGLLRPLWNLPYPHAETSLSSDCPWNVDCITLFLLFLFHLACLAFSLPSYAILTSPSFSSTILYTWSFWSTCYSPNASFASEFLTDPYDLKSLLKSSTWLSPTQLSEFVSGITTSSKPSYITNPNSLKEPFRIQAKLN